MGVRVSLATGFWPTYKYDVGSDTYDTSEKRNIIVKMLREEWDQDGLKWKPVGKVEA